MGKSADELIELQKKVSRTGDRRDNRALEGKLLGFMKHMEDKGYSIGTRKMAYASVLSFFECNSYPLDMHPHDRPTGEGKGSDIPDKKDIEKMVYAAKSRGYRAAIYALKDSGLRISDLVRLKWSDTVDLGEGFWGWKVLTKKRKVQATPFVGPETTQALKLLDRKDERVFPIKAEVLANAVNEIIKRTGLKGITAHGLRKYFNVELQAARVPKEWRYQMMGKKVGAYDENRLSKLFEAYKEVYGYLRIHGSVELSELETQVKILSEEKEELRQAKDNEIERLKAVVDNYKKTFEQDRKWWEDHQQEISDFLKNVKPILKKNVARKRTEKS